MKIIHSDLKKGEVKILVDSIDDLWYISNVIDKGDFVKGQTIRKIKLGGEEDRKSNIIKKKIFLKIKVENVEFHKYSNILRVSGTIMEGPEDVTRGSYHTFNVEENTAFTIEKQHWPDFQIKRLREASHEKSAKILICIMDREEAYFALIKKFGYEILSSIRGDVQKKAVENSRGKDFYAEIKNMIEQYEKRYNFGNIIVASPAFWKEDFMKSLNNKELAKKIVLATCSSCDEKAFNEVLKRQEVQQVLRQERVAKEINLVEELLAEISKNNLAAYGYKEVEEAASAGAVRTLLISEEYINKMKAINKYEEVDMLLKNVDAAKGEIYIVSSEHDGGKKLDGLGGVGAILRYKINQYS